MLMHMSNVTWRRGLNATQERKKCMAITSAEMALRQRREATIREHIDAENHHDPDRTVATFSSYRASYDIPAMGEAGQLADANAVRAMWVGIIAAFPDIHFEPGPLYHGDTHIFVEVRMTGTQQGDFVGIPATGRSFDVRVASLYEFEEDQLVCERVYYDLADILRQLGVFPM
jgi:steroid delta-isomerase-like uncharacterized protein